jgi:hypothetical protein
MTASRSISLSLRGAEGDEAISTTPIQAAQDCFAALAMTLHMWWN